jgi:hypothetical protein
MIEFTKSEKRELRRLAGEAYKAEMEKEVAKLEAAFKIWREGKLNVFDLDEQIHAYSSGPRKELYVFYQMRNQPEAAVARGIAAGLIDIEQVPTELKAKIEHMIGFFKENS